MRISPHLPGNYPYYDFDQDFAVIVMTRKSRKKRLRAGFTTGAAAAAATRAALQVLGGEKVPPTVPIRLLTDKWIDIPVYECITGIDEKNREYASCTVIKDAGDDPDVTHRAEIGAKVRFLEGSDEIVIAGGKGVGTITRPGLELPPGEPAINPGPRKMIREAADAVRKQSGIQKGLHVEVFVPRGEEITRRTLNARLGIVGGISILGTTGVVTPMSHEAYIATIESGVSVAVASGIETVVVTTGRRSERHAQRVLPTMPETAFVQIGDFFGRSMEIAVEMGIKQVVLAVFFGKAVKMACGEYHTHAATAGLSLQTLAGRVAGVCNDAALARSVGSANTAREAFFMIRAACPEMFDTITAQIAENARRFSKKKTAVRVILFDFDGNVLSDIRSDKGET